MYIIPFNIQIDTKKCNKGKVKEKIDNMWSNILYELLHRTNL